MCCLTTVPRHKAKKPGRYKIAYTTWVDYPYGRSVIRTSIPHLPYASGVRTGVGVLLFLALSSPISLATSTVSVSDMLTRKSIARLLSAGASHVPTYLGVTQFLALYPSLYCYDIGRQSTRCANRGGRADYSNPTSQPIPSISPFRTEMGHIGSLHTLRTLSYRYRTGGKSFGEENRASA